MSFTVSNIFTSSTYNRPQHFSDYLKHIQEPSHLKQSRVFETFQQEKSNMPLEPLQRLQSHRCILYQPHSPHLDSSHCRHICTRCSNYLCIMDDVRVLVQPLAAKLFNNRQQFGIELRTINLAPNDLSVLRKTIAWSRN